MGHCKGENERGRKIMYWYMIKTDKRLSKFKLKLLKLLGVTINADFN